MMRRTKIICTIGPACDSEYMIKRLIKAGMNVARLNFSHGSHEEHKRRIDMIRKVSRELNVPVAIMLDTKGPEYRTGIFKDGPVELKKGDLFTFTCDDVKGDGERVSVSYKNLFKELKKGDLILVNNGLLKFRVLEIKGRDIITRILEGGMISDRKSMSFPDKVLKQKFLSPQDEKDIIFGIENDVDFIACSFVSEKENLMDIKKVLKKHGGNNIDLIAKIENRAGYENIEDIFTCCDGIMVARGDMGVEVPMAQLPAIQKKLIYKCRLLGKKSIVATEMLESMIHNIRPTRAETSDVANAVYDGASAIMLSGETAAGQFPVEAVKVMAEIAVETEKNINYKGRFYAREFLIKNRIDAISHATVGMSIDLEAEAIVACTITGQTARMISRFRGPAPILALTTDERTYRKLAITWGVTPLMCPVFKSTDKLLDHARETVKQELKLKKGTNVIITAGDICGKGGNTDLIKAETI